LATDSEAISIMTDLNAPVVRTFRGSAQALDHPEAQKAIQIKKHLVRMNMRHLLKNL
jgi:hypothetical protein